VIKLCLQLLGVTLNQDMQTLGDLLETGFFMIGQAILFHAAPTPMAR
jgi:hypothetical protein